MRRLTNEVDLHTVAMIILFVPGCVVVSIRWTCFGLGFLIVPEVYVLSRAFTHNSSVGRSV